MDWNNQAKTIYHALRFGASLERAVSIVNREVRECPLKPRVWGFLWRPRRHSYVVIPDLVFFNTPPSKKLSRCDSCGHLMMEN